MKKWVILTLCLSTTLGHAAIPRNLCPYLLNISLQNDTGYDCQLFQQSIYQGNSRSTELPLTIPAMQKSPAYTFETEIGYSYPGATEEINVTLTYQCGPDKMLSFNTRKVLTKGFFYQTSVIEGLAISLSNSDAIYMTEKSVCFAYPSIPDTIIWILR